MLIHFVNYNTRPSKSSVKQEQYLEELTLRFVLVLHYIDMTGRPKNYLLPSVVTCLTTVVFQYFFTLLFSVSISNVQTNGCLFIPWKSRIFLDYYTQATPDWVRVRSLLAAVVRQSRTVVRDQSHLSVWTRTGEVHLSTASHVPVTSGNSHVGRPVTASITSSKEPRFTIKAVNKFKFS